MGTFPLSDEHIDTLNNESKWEQSHKLKTITECAEIAHENCDLANEQLKGKNREENR
ncbi:hypothetical protein KKIDH5335_07070 [Vibrio fluvialis]|nr:hypothetical protein KKIDH5335_07070 [Vibrio fluvialis]